MEQWDGSIWERISNHFEKDFYIKIPDEKGVYPATAAVRKLSTDKGDDFNIEQITNVDYDKGTDMSYTKQVLKNINQWMLIEKEIDQHNYQGRVKYIKRLEWTTKNEKPTIHKIKLSDDWMNMRTYLTRFRNNEFWMDGNLEWDIGKT